jgi:hypothetical protein
VFAGCMVITEGVAAVGCAAAAGAVGSLVSYGMSCGSAAGGCSAEGALVSAGVGALGGAVGGALAGPLGGKLASSVLGDVLPDLAVQGLTGAAAGAAAGGVAGAAAYGLGCRSSTAGCTWTGLAAATGQTAAGGAITGAAFATAGGALSSAAARGSVAPEGISLSDAAAACGGMSFTPGTKVFLGSGLAVPIASLKPGDKVLATNVKTGKTSAEPVTAVLVHHDTNRYNLRVKTAQGTTVIDTTRTHLFWDQHTHRWVKASALKYGTRLREPSGSVTVLGGYVPVDAGGWMWDLTVRADHDFYIDVAAAAVLVHNCPVVKTYQTYTKVNPETGQVYAGRTSGYGTPLENIAARDYGHEYNDPGFGPAQLDQSSTNYLAIRGREQMLIEYYRAQGISPNVYNGIRPTNPDYEPAIQAAINEFGLLP